MIKSPKEIEIEECSAQLACLLNGIWHSTLPKIHWSNVVRNTHYVCYVFKYKGALLGVAIWSSPIAANRMRDGRHILELRRLALSNACPKNTATRVLAKMIKRIKVKFPDINKLVSYQDEDAHLGTIYKAGNWRVAKQVPLMLWNTKTRKRNDLQSHSNKIRWEYDIFCNRRKKGGIK